MSKNIEINIVNSSGNYEMLYPKSNWNNMDNKPTIPTVPSLPLSVGNGGTGVTSYSNLANELNDYINGGIVNKVLAYKPDNSNNYLKLNFTSDGVPSGFRLIAIFIETMNKPSLTNNQRSQTLYHFFYSNANWVIPQTDTGYVTQGTDISWGTYSVTFSSSSNRYIYNFINYYGISASNNYVLGVFGKAV